jgi:signal transduction histidine kinase
VVRHAHASRVEIHATADSSEMRLSISDDGVGIRSDRRSGLLNLAERASQHGGTFELTSQVGGGTRLTWLVPLPAQRSPVD